MGKFINQLNFKEKVVLLTGAAGHLGQNFAATLAELGANLVLVDHEASSLKTLAKRLQSSWGIDVKIVTTNLEDESERDKLIERCFSEGKIDTVINNASFVGTSELPGWAVDFEEQALDAWRRALEVNLTAVFHICRDLAPLLSESSSGGCIINIASIYGEFGPDWSLYKGTKMSNPAAYGASKAGIIQLTKFLATTLAPTVRVNAISPGGIFRNQHPEFVSRYEKKTLLNRMATEQDVSSALIFLASDMSKYITGENLRVSGGWGLS